MPETTPYDTIWSNVGSALLSAAIAIYLFLTTGVFGLFDGSSGQLEDARVVAVAYIGGLILSAGLAGMAAIALLALGDDKGPRNPPWPRFKMLEGSEGPRSRAIARISLALLLTLPYGSLYASVDKYVGKSVIAEWDGKRLGDGFSDSRRAAMSHDCTTDGACLRMHPDKGAPEWFVLSDPSLMLLILTSAGLWIGFAVRANRRRCA